MKSYDVNKIRKDFPILHQTVHGKPLVYLDNAATTQKPRQVIRSLTHYYEHDNANVHRGIHTLAERATHAFEAARAKVAHLVGTACTNQLVWTRGTTEGINLVAYAWARPNLKPGDEILLTLMEHHSNLVPWQMVAQDTGAVLKFIPLREDYTLDLDKLDELLTSKTKLVAISHMSNVLGTINPVKEITAAAHRVGARVLVDAAQSVPHMPVDACGIDADFLLFSGHKMLGPTGIGVLFGKLEVLEAMRPFHGGGEMITEVGLERSTYKPAPHKLEAGPPPIAQAIAMGAAVDYLTELGLEAVIAHEQEITEYALEVLDRVGDVTIFGPRENRGSAVSFAVEGVHPHDLATIVDSEGVAIRAGHHCAQPLMKWLDVPATARASFYLYNTREEVDALAEAIEKAKRIFGRAGQPV
jgi:cysteine desulfurase/selenocysteine lyase